MKLTEIYNPLRRELQKIEHLLIETIDANHPILEQASLQLLQAGGKRIRPVFVLLASQFGHPTKYNEEIYHVAVALELIHMATLVHDDVVDDATLRRGQPTIKHSYDNRIAMYSGDYILARALEIITKVENKDIHRTLSKALVKIVEGEIDQIEDKYNVKQSLKTYLKRIKRKTALLIAKSCKLGALASNVSATNVRHLYRYGYYVGMSFQIIDDILDITATADDLGKPTGSDLLQGNITLPVLYAMENEHFYQSICQMFHHPKNISEEDMSSLLEMLKQTDAIERAYKVSNAYLHKALQSANKLPNKKGKDSLKLIAKIIGARQF